MPFVFTCSRVLWYIRCTAWVGNISQCRKRGSGCWSLHHYYWCIVLNASWWGSTWALHISPMESIALLNLCLRHGSDWGFPIKVIVEDIECAKPYRWTAYLLSSPPEIGHVRKSGRSDFNNQFIAPRRTEIGVFLFDPFIVHDRSRVIGVYGSNYQFDF